MTENSKPQFDQYATDYEAMHAASVAASGESTVYFADYKVGVLQRLGVKPSDPILDYGCGIGNLVERLFPAFENVHGFDPSTKSLEVAQRRAPSAVLHADIAAIPEQHFECAVLSCVLHHVPVAERLALMQTLRRKLSPRGRVFIFEHNPFNPVTRRAVATCPFDHDAVLLWPWEAKRLAKAAGFEAVNLEYITFFPHALAALRPLEPSLTWLPLGAQYVTVGANPADA
ncbi:MAG TPA: methyltransferase domain-containing protein [Polyangiaceae bacterium]|nr:methyltransferase domain-containing protein [Polyangiaceae bacterium]